mmetsp:Transcript_2655/g.5753  ORF Transcript_2655/g.5753 Transcript_2655/m.5753 type:complete len:191 (-) Transcript_2655:58-630(-)
MAPKVQKAWFPDFPGGDSDDCPGDDCLGYKSPNIDPMSDAKLSGACWVEEISQDWSVDGDSNPQEVAPPLFNTHEETHDVPNDVTPTDPPPASRPCDFWGSAPPKRSLTLPVALRSLPISTVTGPRPVRRHVSFGSPLCSPHAITPYSRIYMAHPSTFDFDAGGGKIWRDEVQRSTVAASSPALALSNTA